MIFFKQNTRKSQSVRQKIQKIMIHISLIYTGTGHGVEESFSN
jgi:hypothetical protein